MTREQKNRRRRIRRDLALLALVIIIMVGAECLANYIAPICM